MQFPLFLILSNQYLIYIKKLYIPGIYMPDLKITISLKQHAMTESNVCMICD